MADSKASDPTNRDKGGNSAYEVVQDIVEAMLVIELLLLRLRSLSSSSSEGGVCSLCLGPRNCDDISSSGSEN